MNRTSIVCTQITQNHNRSKKPVTLRAIRAQDNYSGVLIKKFFFPILMPFSNVIPIYSNSAHLSLSEFYVLQMLNS